MFNPKDFGLCPGNSSCVLADLDGSVSGSNFCAVTDDVKLENSYNRSEQEYTFIHIDLMIFKSDYFLLF